MSIICVTNLSPQSVRAGTAAAALGVRLGEPLVLRSVEEQAGPMLGEGAHLRAVPNARLEAEAERLRGLGAQVRAVRSTRLGPLLEDEECQRARWLVVAAEGWRTAAWRAPVPERLVRAAHSPVLVVRDDVQALLEWMACQRRLRVLVGVNPADEADSAPDFLRALREVAPCDVLAAHVCSPPEERTRLGIHTPVRLELLDPVVRGMQALDEQVEQVLRREVLARVGTLPGQGEVEVHLEPGYGRRSDHLLHVARERGVDLVLVGTHQRGGLKRWWHGSVSQQVLRHASQPVVCVPAAQAPRRHLAAPRSVLVPVDFSEASLRAVAQARWMLGEGGRIHLLHVHARRLGDPGWMDHYGVLPEPPAERDEVLRKLWALVPQQEAPEVQWSVEGVSSAEPALAICQAAERQGVDLVCVGTHEGRLGRVGGLARELVSRCHRPVLVVPSASPGKEPRGWAPGNVHPQ